MKKEQIRLRIRAHKALLSSEERKNSAIKVWEAVERTGAFIMAERVLLYNSLPDELDTHSFIEKWQNKKRLYLPRVNGVTLDILPCDGREMPTGAFCISEPVGTDVERIENIDLVIVPAVAYDRTGSRVGRGKGYYDRLLASTLATKIGVGYDFQVIDDIIETDSHDVPVDIVITENRTIRAIIKNKTNT